MIKKKMGEDAGISSYQDVNIKVQQTTVNWSFSLNVLGKICKDKRNQVELGDIVDGN